jgi:hypothetical protein
LLAIGAAGFLILPYWLSGGRYRELLVRAIDSADRIVVTEHSYPGDTKVLYRSQASPPSSLYGALAELVSGIGLQPKRDWRALAEAQPL